MALTRGQRRDDGNWRLNKELVAISSETSEEESAADVE
jgi:hypothetical protein